MDRVSLGEEPMTVFQGFCTVSSVCTFRDFFKRVVPLTYKGATFTISEELKFEIKIRND
jgi:hypothetical protein